MKNVTPLSWGVVALAFLLGAVSSAFLWCPDTNGPRAPLNDPMPQLQHLDDQVRELSAQISALASQVGSMKSSEAVQSRSQDTSPTDFSEITKELAEVRSLLLAIGGRDRSWHAQMSEARVALSTQQPEQILPIVDGLVNGSADIANAAEQELLVMPVPELVRKFGKPAKILPQTDGRQMWKYRFQGKELQVFVHQGLVYKVRDGDPKR